MALGLKALQRIKGRRAIVIFTDGVDSYSDRESYEKNRRMIEEAGIIIYPIRFDTRADVERLVRQQQQSGQIIDLAGILGGTTGTTPTTFPGGTTIPSGRTGGGVGTLPQLPGGIIIGGSRRTNPYPPGDPRNNDPRNDPRNNDPTSPGRRTSNDPITAELDMMYLTADSYLDEIAEKSGGRLNRADSLVALPVAFAQIAAELRTQYSLGYYPAKPGRDGKYRKIKVSTSRKNVVLRARPGYRTPSGGE